MGNVQWCTCSCAFTVLSHSRPLPSCTYSRHLSENKRRLETFSEDQGPKRSKRTKEHCGTDPVDDLLGSFAHKEEGRDHYEVERDPEDG
jgi:hypothetical protein